MIRRPQISPPPAEQRHSSELWKVGAGAFEQRGQLTLPFELDQVNFGTRSGSRECDGRAYGCLAHPTLTGNDQDPRCPDNAFNTHCGSG